jgi:peptide/nickel transport system ATP-binding protein
MASAPALLQVNGLQKTYGGRRVVNDVSVTVGAGEAVALVGESGSGKSTIARLLSRLAEPDGGQILLDGRDVLHEERRGPSLSYRRALQMVFQDPFASLNPIHPVRHHLERPLLRHRRVDRAGLEAKVCSLLTMVGLSPPSEFIDAFPNELSGGQRQRVAIARALAVEPRLLIADEPTSMLDASVRMGVLGVLQGLVKTQGLGLLLITHDLATARLLCDRVIVLFGGHVVEEGDAERLLSTPTHPYTRSLLAALPKGVPRAAAPTQLRTEAPAAGPGCPFLHRCTEAIDVCRNKVPLLSPTAVGTQVRCFVRGQNNA